MILDRLRLEHDVLAVDDDLAAETVGMGAQLLLDQRPQRGAVPIVGDEKILRATDGHEPRAEALQEVIDRARARRGLTGDGVDHGKQVLRAVGELAQQQTKLILRLLPLGDVDGDGGGADDAAAIIAQRLDHEIERPLAAEQRELAFDGLGFARLHGAALSPPRSAPQRLRAAPRLRSCRRGRTAHAGRWIVHPDIAHVAILAEHRDRRASERDLEALLRLRPIPWCGFRRAPRVADAPPSAHPRCADARRSRPPADRATGAVKQRRQQLPEHDRRDQGEHRARRIEHALQSRVRHPQREGRGEMRKTGGRQEQGEQREQNLLAPAPLAAA